MHKLYEGSPTLDNSSLCISLGMASLPSKRRQKHLWRFWTITFRKFRYFKLPNSSVHVQLISFSFPFHRVQPIQFLFIRLIINNWKVISLYFICIMCAFTFLVDNTYPLFSSQVNSMLKFWGLKSLTIFLPNHRCLRLWATCYFPAPLFYPMTHWASSPTPWLVYLILFPVSFCKFSPCVIVSHKWRINLQAFL